VLAIVRPDLTVHLVEPMLRRTTWLATTIESLGVPNCTVHRGRAEELRGRLSAPFATARAVARIDKLARWTFPLLSPGGTLVALKGTQGAEELAAEDAVLRRLGMVSAAVRTYGAEVLEVPTVTIELTLGDRPTAGRTSRRSGGRGSGSPRRRPQGTRGSRGSAGGSGGSAGGSRDTGGPRL
jgi:16S rRNA (guanine527-N7)-methyltransferase